MARTNDLWETGVGGTYIQTIGSPNGYDLLINGTNHYINFGSVVGASGYGIRDNAGTMQFKNSGGAWDGIASTSMLYWTQSASALFPTTTSNRILLGGATDDTTSALQVSGTSHFNGGNTYAISAAGQSVFSDGGNSVYLTDGSYAMQLMGNIRMGGTIVDSLNGYTSVDIGNRQLYDSAQVLTLDWNADQLIIPSSSVAIDWSGAYNGSASITWGSGAMYFNSPIYSGTNGSVSVDSVNRTLNQDNSYVMLDYTGSYNASSLLSFDNSNQAVIITNSINDKNNTPYKSIDPNSRILYAGGNPIIDWSGAFNSSSQLSFSSGINAVFGNAIVDGSLYASLDTNNRYLYDGDGSTIVAKWGLDSGYIRFPQGIAEDGGSYGVSVNPNNRTLVASDGTTMVDWYNSNIFNLVSTNLQINTSYTILGDGGSGYANSIDANNRILYGPDGSTHLMDFNNTTSPKFPTVLSGAGVPGTILTNFQVYVDTVTGIMYLT